MHHLICFVPHSDPKAFSRDCGQQRRGPNCKVCKLQVRCGFRNCGRPRNSMMHSRRVETKVYLDHEQETMKIAECMLVAFAAE